MFALEKQLGMGNGTIGKWGKNGRVPNYAKLSAVCSALGVSVEDVMSDDPIPGIKKAPGQEAEGGSLTEKDLALIRWFRALPEDKQKAILVAQDAPESLLD